jgi:hypothetical protein
VDLLETLTILSKNSKKNLTNMLKNLDFLHKVVPVPEFPHKQPSLELGPLVGKGVLESVWLVLARNQITHPPLLRMMVEMMTKEKSAKRQ